MRSHRLILASAIVLALGYVWLRGGFIGLGAAAPAEQTAASSQGAEPAARADGNAVATFASGCFWCTEADFDKVKGVVSTTSGYTGGTVANPTYKQVTSGSTGHAEAVQIVFNPSVVTYEQLLDHYWKNVDPFTPNRQFCDTGTQYRPVIFVHGARQRAAAEASRAQVQKKLGMPVVVAVQDAGVFYRAEDYHQDYHVKSDAQYRFYRWGCGRDARLKEIWGS